MIFTKHNQIMWIHKPFRNRLRAFPDTESHKSQFHCTAPIQLLSYCILFHDERLTMALISINLWLIHHICAIQETNPTLSRNLQINAFQTMWRWNYDWELWESRARVCACVCSDLIMITRAVMGLHTDWHPIFFSSNCDSFQDRGPVDEIYSSTGPQSWNELQLLLNDRAHV